MTAFPDLVIKMDSLDESGAEITYHCTLTGTNTGPGGTGKFVRISGFEEWRFGSDAQIADSKGHFDATDYQHQLNVSGCENPRNSGRQETRFAEQKRDRREITVSSEKSSRNLWHSKSRDCLARKRNNMTSKAKTVPGI